MNSDGQPARRRDTTGVQYSRVPPSHESVHIPSSDNDDATRTNNATQAASSEWDERHTVQKQYLTILEAASLIVNKMIGTGIFATPGMVLALTQNKSLALGFWVIGGLYAAIW